MSDVAEFADFRTHRDENDREFAYAIVRHPGAQGLVVHFSAFFMNSAGLPRQHRAAFSGYFHRLRMLGADPSHHWLFLCDQYGVESDGCYYTGSGGDFFVERAVGRVIDEVVRELGVTSSEIVTVGSSMGGTGALKFGLRLGVRAIAIVSPHIDLDVCAAQQGRWRHVAYLCPDGQPTAVHNFGYTRQIRNELVQSDATPPRLYVQACADDKGVYEEQVVPLVEVWRRRGGRVDMDLRLTGGHTSEWATAPLLLDVLSRLLSEEDLPIVAYQGDPLYQPKRATPPIRWRLRQRAGRLRNRLRAKLARKTESGPGDLGRG